MAGYMGRQFRVSGKQLEQSPFLWEQSNLRIGGLGCVLCFRAILRNHKRNLHHIFWFASVLLL